MKLGRPTYGPVLRGLNDVAFSPDIAAMFYQEEGFTKSLTRFSEAEKALSEGRLLFAHLAPTGSEKTFTFRFLCRVPGAETDHVIDFNFTPDHTDLHRMVALIGKNGTGKTQVLAKFASAMSGWNREAGEFIPKRPNFSKVIAISYSVFDRFDRPEEGVDSFSYVYCGIRRGNRRLTDLEPGALQDIDRELESDAIYSPQEMEQKLLAALEQVETQNREIQWQKVVSELLEEKIAVKNLRRRNGTLNYSVYNRLSSGQIILVRLMSEVIASIAEESIVLFDEPEIHLHPQALSALVRAFYVLLNEFNSYAVLATHSPMMLQQIPAKRVRVFKREGTYPIVKPLGIESFGENLTIITNEVFGTSELYGNYQEHLRDLATKHSYEEVLTFFDHRLGLNARAFLSSLYPSNKRGTA
jgi:ABC-type lipoprotein export system ATPase subunit